MDPCGHINVSRLRLGTTRGGRLKHRRTGFAPRRDACSHRKTPLACPPARPAGNEHSAAAGREFRDAMGTDRGDLKQEWRSAARACVVAVRPIPLTAVHCGEMTPGSFARCTCDAGLETGAPAPRLLESRRCVSCTGGCSLSRRWSWRSFRWGSGSGCSTGWRWPTRPGFAGAWTAPGSAASCRPPTGRRPGWHSSVSPAPRRTPRGS